MRGAGGRPEGGIRVFVSEEIASRKLVEAFEVDQRIYDRINAAYGTDFKLRR